MWRSCGLKASNVFKDLVKKGGGKFRGQNPCGVLGLSNCGWSFERRDGFAAAIGGGDGESEKVSRGVFGGGGLPISFGEAKRLMRLVNVEALKARLGTEGKEAIPYDDLIEACQSIGVARSKEEAVAFARVLDEAGVILLFRDKVLLHPDRVVDLVRKAVPLALTPDNDPVWEELRKMQENKIAIDILAHKHVRRVLWGGLGLITAQVALFFRMTYWDFSWDVVEPLAYFTTTGCIGVGYAYFLVTSRDPTYQDLMKRLFLRKQRKLLKKQNFDVERFREIQKKYDTTLHASTSIKNKYGMDVELDDALHRD